MTHQEGRHPDPLERIAVEGDEEALVMTRFEQCADGTCSIAVISSGGESHLKGIQKWN
jgi:hypothetical protein